MLKQRFPHPRGYVCYRAESQIKLNGRMDDPAWRNAPWTKPFIDIEGLEKPSPTWDTRVKMLWDDYYFYVAAKMVEPHVWATLTKHDSVIFHDNDFEVFIDPDADNHQYYEYEINAFGTDWDLRLTKPYRDSGQALNGWEIPGLRKAVHVEGTVNDPTDEDEWWGVEMAFPWAVLGEYSKDPAPPRAGDQWRVNFSRVEWDVNVVDGKYEKIKGRPEHNWVWSPQHAINMHRPEFWGYVQFSHMPPGTDEFHPDENWDARMRLMQIYEKQKAFMKKNERWAVNLDELDLDGDEKIKMTKDGWQATANGLHVRQDSLIW